MKILAFSLIIFLSLSLLSDIKFSAPEILQNANNETLVKINFSGDQEFLEEEISFYAYKSNNPFNQDGIKYTLLETLDKFQRLTIALDNTFLDDYLSFRLQIKNDTKKDIFIFLPSDARRVIAQRRANPGFKLPAKKIVGEPRIFEEKINTNTEENFILEEAVDETPVFEGTQVLEEPPNMLVEAEDVDTIWSVSRNLTNDYDANIYQIMWSLFISNPNAFIDGNIHKVRSDTDLIIPPEEVINSIDPMNAKDSINLMDPASNNINESSRLVLTVPEIDERDENLIQSERIPEDGLHSSDEIGSTQALTLMQDESPEALIKKNTRIINFEPSALQSARSTNQEDSSLSYRAITLIAFISLVIGFLVAVFLINRKSNTLSKGNTEIQAGEEPHEISIFDEDLSIENDKELQLLDLARTYIEMDAFEDAAKILDDLIQNSSDSRLIEDANTLKEKLIL